jgi:type VI secretion system secreted protein VgrG
MAAGRVAFRLKLGTLSEAELVVRRVDGREGLSEPYGFEVEFSPASGRALEVADVLGQEALLRMERPTGQARLVHGEATRLELREVAAGQPRYRVTLGPRLHRLARAERSRVYQGKTVPEIAQQVLSEHGADARSSLSGAYLKREYVIQHRETDLGFVSRLLEDEGIWYRFEHAESGHTVVLGDGPGAWVGAGAELPVREETGQEDEEEFVRRIARERSVVVGRVVTRDYEFTRPDSDLTARAEVKADLEVYEWPGGYQQPSEGARRARTRLEGLRFGEEWWWMEGNAVALEPGARLAVDGVGEVAVVRLEHHALQEVAAGAAQALTAAYRNAFLAIGAKRPYRPRRRWSKPVVNGVETATVVGPSSEEIHTEAHGRVKVQFHWDREGRGDEAASCWVRLAQAWAGAGMGASYLPRVGQEVVVRFLEGDPDRPLVTGAVYNGSNVPPLQLPAEKTKSTLRTATSPGSGGSNELRLEDAQGAEEVWLHAQRDESIAAEHDRNRQVRANERVQVGQDRAQEVGGNQRLRVELLDATEVGRNQALTVAKDRQTAVGVAHEEVVEGTQAVAVAQNRHVEVLQASAVFVGAGAALDIGGAYAVNVAGVHNQAVGGLKSSQVGGAAVEWVGATRAESVAGDRTSSSGGDSAVEVDGDFTSGTEKDASGDVAGAEGIEVKETMASVAQKVELIATDKLSIVVGGKVALILDKSGNVTLAGAAITVDGSEAKLRGAQISKIAAGSASSGTVQVAQLAPIQDPRAFVLFTLADQDGKPVANEPFEVVLPDGAVKRGRTDGGGKAAVPGSKPGTAQVTFTELDGRTVKER